MGTERVLVGPSPAVERLFMSDCDVLVATPGIVGHAWASNILLAMFVFPCLSTQGLVIVMG